DAEAQAQDRDQVLLVGALLDLHVEGLGLVPLVLPPRDLDRPVGELALADAGDAIEEKEDLAADEVEDAQELGVTADERQGGRRTARGWEGGPFAPVSTQRTHHAAKRRRYYFRASGDARRRVSALTEPWTSNHPGGT